MSAFYCFSDYFCGMPSIQQFDTIDYLKGGNPKQKRAFEVLSRKNIMAGLADFDALLVGTVPIAIDTDHSDLDIICHWKDSSIFRERLSELFGSETGFRLTDMTLDGLQTIVTNFKTAGFEIEIFGQAIPVKKQNAYRHMVSEHLILESKGADFRNAVIKLKEQGYKTEPAFGLLLGLANPYEELLDYQIGKQ